MISIICPTYNEQQNIAACIESIIRQTYPFAEIELIVSDGMSTDSTRKIVETYCKKYSNIRMIDNPGIYAPSGLNRAIEVASGDVVMRIDAHSVYPSNYVDTLFGHLQQLGADNVGCVCRTLPANDTSVCKAIALGLSHPFGVGDSAFRVMGRSDDAKPVKVDTVPFGCFRRSVFERIGLFDEELVRNQDDEFNGRIIRNGGSVYLIPSISVDYYARDSFHKLWKMYFQYGLFKPLVNSKLGYPATVRQFFPSAFVLGIVLGGFLSCFSSILRILYHAVLILYVILCMLFGIKAAKEEKDISLIFLLPYAFIVLHVSYGLGYLIGYFYLLCGKTTTIKSNR